MFRLPTIPIDNGEDILPLALVKQHLEIESHHRDELLVQIRDAAIDAVQIYTEKRMVETEIVWRGSNFPSSAYGPIRLGIGPVVSVASLSYRDKNDDKQSIAVEDVTHKHGSEIFPKRGKAWPREYYSDDMDLSIEITLTVGYGHVPPALKSAMLLFCGHLYENREAVVTGTIAIEVPLGFNNLCNKYKEFSL